MCREPQREVGEVLAQMPQLYSEQEVIVVKLNGITLIMIGGYGRKHGSSLAEG